MDDFLVDRLVCPRDRLSLSDRGSELMCRNSHRYPVFDGIPILLVGEAESTHAYIDHTLEQVQRDDAGEAIRPRRSLSANRHEVDAFVQGEVPYTSGTLYFPVQNRLTRYPIPHFRLPEGHGERLLDIGCNWGRWTIAAARSGYRPVGMDPSLDAILAARRVCEQLGISAEFIVGDARFLPFAAGSFDTVFSYGVFQHFAKENARLSLSEVHRVLGPYGWSVVQMPNRQGVRQSQQHRRRGFTEGEGFDVRYWSPAELLATFQELVGPSKISADCFFGLGIQVSDVDLLPLRYQAVVRASQSLVFASRWCEALRMHADSLYVESRRNTESYGLT